MRFPLQSISYTLPWELSICKAHTNSKRKNACNHLPDQGFSCYFAVYGSFAILTPSGCFYFLLPKNRENYDKGYEYDGESSKELINIPEALITEDKLADIPCEVFWNSQWYERKIIREVKMLRGIGKQFCRIYLVEIGTPPFHQWLSAELICQTSAEQEELEKYH